MSKKKDPSSKPKRPLYKKVVTVLLTGLLALAITRVVLTNVLATSGQNLAAANQKIRDLEEENQKLENEISSLASLERIEKLAQKKGFVKSKNVQILTGGEPIANR